MLTAIKIYIFKKRKCDSYRSWFIPVDIFKEIISEDAKYRSIFEDFTYYPDTTSGYPYTEANITLLMTGRFYKNQQSFENYKRDTFLQTHCRQILKRKIGMLFYSLS